jgi:hypothetical protein
MTISLVTCQFDSKPHVFNDECQRVSNVPFASTVHRVLVTGSRYWTDQGAIHRALFTVEHIALSAKPPGGPFTLVQGGARGADSIAASWAHSRVGWAVEEFRADWDRHGRKAGPIRNREMIKSGVDICLAFLHERSRGAKGCADMAEAAGIPVWRVNG